MLDWPIGPAVQATVKHAAPQTHPHSLTAHGVNLAVLLSFCGVLAWMRWCKMESLMWQDPPHWLHQMARVAWGDLPYRDFSWNYPPLAAFLFGWTLRGFGVTFQVVQAAEDLLSLAVVLLAYVLGRYFLPRTLQLAVPLVLTAVCVTSLTKFNLFSFLSYSPSQQTGTIGLFLLLIGIYSYLRKQNLDWRNTALIVGGAFISILSKPESWLAACAALAVWALMDRSRTFAGMPFHFWLYRYGILFAACILPALAVLGWTAAAVGYDNLKAGILGYGLGTFACPWWPTGVGLFGALASLGQAACIAALLSLTRRRQFVASYGRRYARLWWTVPPGLLLYLGYQIYLNQEMLRSSLSPAAKLQGILPTLIWTNPVLLPVMWVSICYWAYLAVRLVRSRLPARSDAELFLLLTVSVVLSIRGLFNTTLEQFTEVSAICYPFYLILGPYLLWRFLKSAGSAGRARSSAYVVVVFVGLYGVARLAGGYPTLLSDAPYQKLRTNAGDVWLLNYKTDAEIYRYVLANTSESDTLLDLPYGGGMNFATGRRSPVFNTLFRCVRIPEVYQRLDLKLLREARPRVVIVENQRHFGTTYGIEAPTKCPCPRLVWQPTESTYEPNRVYPLVRYIEQNYRVEKTVGSKLLLVPRGS